MIPEAEATDKGGNTDCAVLEVRLLNVSWRVVMVQARYSLECCGRRSRASHFIAKTACSYTISKQSIRCPYACNMCRHGACTRACMLTCVRACVSVCVRAWVRGCVGACVGGCARARVRECVHLCARPRAHVCLRACMYACMHVWMSIRVHACVYVNLCVHAA